MLKLLSISLIKGPLGGSEVGCYADTTEKRDLEYLREDNPPGGLTHQYCSKHCFQGVGYVAFCFTFIIWNFYILTV